jgi:hypothetical protein
MTNRLAIQPPAVSRRFLNAAMNQVVTPAPALPGADFEGFTVWLSALCTPTQLNSSFDVFSGGQSGAGAAMDSYGGGFGGTSGAHYFLLFADLKPGAVTALVDNTATVFFAAKPVARIAVCAAAQKGGMFLLHSGGTQVLDNRFVMGGAGTALSAGTISSATKIYTKTAGNHGLETGDRVILTSLTGGTGLTAAATYYFHKLSPTTGYLCASYANALAGTFANVTADATNVILTIPGDIGIALTTVDPALRIFIEGGFTD